MAFGEHFSGTYELANVFFFPRFGRREGAGSRDKSGFVAASLLNMDFR